MVNRLRIFLSSCKHWLRFTVLSSIFNIDTNWVTALGLTGLLCTFHDSSFYFDRETVEDHWPTNNVTNTSSLESPVLDGGSLSMYPDPFQEHGTSSAAWAQILLELPWPETGLIINLRKQHSVRTMEMLMINDSIFHFNSCIPIQYQ